MVKLTLLTYTNHPEFSEKCIRENVFGKTLFYQVREKLVREKLMAPNLKWLFNQYLFLLI